MLITANLPINRDKFAQNDQILTITGASWSDYQNFASPEYPGYRVSYFAGEITIVSPGRNHERIAAVVDRLIIAYCEKYALQDFPFGQTRLNAWGQAGKEPDLAYAFDRDTDLPDLVVEVIFSSGDTETLKSSYQQIGVKELWIWKENEISFYFLENDKYIAIAQSNVLSELDSEFFVKFINRGLTESPAIIKQDFLKAL